MSNIYKKYKHERNLPFLDAGLAMGHIILYAKSRGIDTCIVNLSEYHYASGNPKISLPRKIINRIIRKLTESFGLQRLLKNNLEYFLRNELNIPTNYKILGAVVLGYAQRYPDIEKEKHGGKMVKREAVDYYILNKE